MKAMLWLALQSAWNRRHTLGLTLVALSLSVAMLLGVERAREAARQGFAQSIAGTDLIVGARGSPVQLLLYSVFRLGEASHDMSWSSFQRLRDDPAVAWVIPLTLGDSHQGFPVLGTNQDYFEHLRYGDQLPLALASGRRFEQLFEVVIGAEVARQLGYKLGDRLALSHGQGTEALASHEDLPFEVVGVLARTGTPVDRTLHVSLQALEAIHLGWQGGAPLPGLSIPARFVQKFDLEPKRVTAALVGLENRAGVFRLQRALHQYPGEALQAVLPGVALDQLWNLLGVVEQTLAGVSLLVLAMGLSTMVAIVWAGLGERRRELAILRSVGAGRRHIVALLALEGLLLSLAGALLGYGLLGLAAQAAAGWTQSELGLTLPAWGTPARELKLLAGVLLAGLCASLLPAWRAARLTLSDGLMPRL
ncbi:ABC transporter permease [Malikia granosa]|uniref:Peptide ABC transporter permease n=1 Tax=Malikia granosa TaxID=263067 RepID=A0A2S9K6M6_9BURK|nr:ABC transporter permease [Malikia granosa]PRD66119.1 peptide ABC transporter permease [Malikia granosa]